MPPLPLGDVLVDRPRPHLRDGARVNVEKGCERLARAPLLWCIANPTYNVVGQFSWLCPAASSSVSFHRSPAQLNAAPESQRSGAASVSLRKVVDKLEQTVSISRSLVGWCGSRTAAHEGSSPLLVAGLHVGQVVRAQRTGVVLHPESVAQPTLRSVSVRDPLPAGSKALPKRHEFSNVLRNFIGGCVVVGSSKIPHRRRLAATVVHRQAETPRVIPHTVPRVEQERSLVHTQTEKSASRSV